MNNIAIRAERLSKKYRLGVINRRQLVDQIESWVCRRMGRPDPHAYVFDHATDRMPTPYDFWALKDVSFEIKRGDIVGIMGRNGSGKSTLLKLLSRITAPTAGQALIQGRVASLLEVGTGFNPELTGRENVYLNGSILGLKQREIDARYDSIVEFAEIPDFMDTPVKRYSSGMRVRLAFAVAAHLEPDIMILDEVLAVGDAKFQEKCLNRIGEIKNSGVTILFVSHSAESVMQLCTHGLLLQDGKIITNGTAKEVATSFYQSMGLGSPDDVLHGIPDSRVGQCAGEIAEILIANTKNGRIVFNIPVATGDSFTVVDVGWISEERIKNLNTIPIWNAAPDICVNIVSTRRTPEQITGCNMKLLKYGAVEVWTATVSREIVRFKNPQNKYLVAIEDIRNRSSRIKINN
jgi:ABC-type polysaccharide/polyol phosphate transport system ATPase subunit